VIDIEFVAGGSLKAIVLYWSRRLGQPQFCLQRNDNSPIPVLCVQYMLSLIMACSAFSI